MVKEKKLNDIIQKDAKNIKKNMDQLHYYFLKIFNSDKDFDCNGCTGDAGCCE